ncbi:calmodulin-dependent protein kinase [Gigaspora margarita]|uniref:Calmodulin-dependent protein kinase n=1 Tax=Gigaspora margarita TaxID=4874 RepID=A0A8H3X4J1_GIGMA|nr:calmodulin-dependent protein kinase [Gigaspora margarita]
MTKQFNNFFEENYIRNLQFDSFETDITVLSSNSYKLVSKIYNNNVVLSKISFSNKYTIKDFINDLRQYRKVELHENIIKFIGIIKQSIHGIMFIHEYANKGTLRQYLDQNFYMLNWNDKFNLAKQLVSAIKCLHESDIVHLNLNPKNIFVHEGNLKLNVFGAFQYQSKFLNKIKLMQYTDPQYLETHETYKLNKSSDVYSIGVLLWEISSGIVPFKSELSYGFNLLNAIIHDDNNKCPFKILEQYYNHQLRICFTGIIGFFYEYGIGTSVDYCKAFDMYKKAAEEFYFANNDSLNKRNYFFTTDDLLKENQIIGLISLGNLYIYGKGVLVNKQKAFQLFLKSVIRGSVLGKCYIGDCYHYGYGVIEDHSQSFDWYLKSAEEGNARAQNAVGYCYQFSEKIPKNDYLAFTWFSKSIDNGNYLGYRNLGYCYQFGIGTPVDEKKAFKYFKKSANGENSLGQNDLGYCYQNGRGTLKNESKAFLYYMKSAENGNSLGQCNLGRCYSHGIGTSVDEKLASEWYKKSVKRGRYKIGQHCFLHV